MNCALYKSDESNKRRPFRFLLHKSIVFCVGIFLIFIIHLMIVNSTFELELNELILEQPINHEKGNWEISRGVRKAILPWIKIIGENELKFLLTSTPPPNEWPYILQDKITYQVYKRIEDDNWVNVLDAPKNNNSWAYTSEQSGEFLLVSTLSPLLIAPNQLDGKEILRLLSGQSSNRRKLLAFVVEKPVKPLTEPNNQSHDGNYNYPDLRTIQNGVDDLQQVYSSEINENFDNSIPLVVAVPPREKTKDLNDDTSSLELFEGCLPELHINININQLKNLNLANHISLTTRYNMPLVLVPREIFIQNEGNIIPIVLPQSYEIINVDKDKLHELYGRIPLKLEYFSNEVLNHIRDNVDPVIWAKAKERFYLISNATLEPVKKAVENGWPLESIKVIHSRLDIVRQGEVTFFEIQDLEVQSIENK